MGWRDTGDIAFISDNHSQSDDKKSLHLGGGKVSGLDPSIFLFRAQINPPECPGMLTAGTVHLEVGASWVLLCVQGAGLGVGLHGVMGEMRSRRARGLHEFQCCLNAKGL